MVSCAVIGSYAVIVPIDHYIGSSLKYIVLNVVRRATVHGFGHAVLDPPYQDNGMTHSLLSIDPKILVFISLFGCFANRHDLDFGVDWAGHEWSSFPVPEGTSATAFLATRWHVASTNVASVRPSSNTDNFQFEIWTGSADYEFRLRRRPSLRHCVVPFFSSSGNIHILMAVAIISPSTCSLALYTSPLSLSQFKVIHSSNTPKSSAYFLLPLSSSFRKSFCLVQRFDAKLPLAALVDNIYILLSLASPPPNCRDLNKSPFARFSPSKTTISNITEKLNEIQNDVRSKLLKGKKK